MTVSAASRVIVVGGGIVGLSTAYKLLQRRPGLDVVVLEKETSVARHQTGHNSGVLHAGLYYRPGSFKARLAVAGVREMTSFCRDHGVPFEICGKLVVAVDDAERSTLKMLAERGRANGLTGVELLDLPRMREIEPHVGGVAGLRVPEEGIVDYTQVSAALVRQIAEAGGRVVTAARVHAVSRRSSGWVVGSGAGVFEGNFLVTCAGLHADRMLKLTGQQTPVQIVPFRGEYYRLAVSREYLVRHLIYPVPDPAFPFLGVHFTRMIRGGVEAGPNAVLALAREGYRRGQISLRDLAGTLAFPGLWRFLARHAGAAAGELRRSFSRERFAASLGRLVPAIGAADLEPGGAGVRAQAMHPDGTLVEDFLWVEGRGVLHVVNAPSPAATASLAIGGEIAGRVLERLAA